MQSIRFAVVQVMIIGRPHVVSCRTVTPRTVTLGQERLSDSQDAMRHMLCQDLGNI